MSGSVGVGANLEGDSVHKRKPQAPNVRRRFWIEGRVQMVGFRAFATLHARRLRLRGWVRNTESGAVEVVAEGSPDSIAEFAQLLRRGPAAAEVIGFSSSEEAANVALTEFRPAG
jgi:acylphosphatase